MNYKNIEEFADDSIDIVTASSERDLYYGVKKLVGHYLKTIKDIEIIDIECKRSYAKESKIKKDIKNGMSLKESFDEQAIASGSDPDAFGSNDNYNIEKQRCIYIQIKMRIPKLLNNVCTYSTWVEYRKTNKNRYESRLFYSKL